MRALPAPAEALPQAPPGGMIPPGPPRIFTVRSYYRAAGGKTALLGY